MKIAGWGRYPVADAHVYAPRNLDELIERVAAGQAIARGNGRAYGSAKAGFTAFLSGLRNRLAKKGVHVVTVLPGFVATKMTQGMDLPAKLTADPSEVGQAVFQAATRGHDVIYVRKIWFVIMMIIRNIP